VPRNVNNVNNVNNLAARRKGSFLEGLSANWPSEALEQSMNLIKQKMPSPLWEPPSLRSVGSAPKSDQPFEFGPNPSQAQSSMCYCDEKPYRCTGSE